ncbi:MAG: helicase-associated domain-containing protein [Thermoflexales bacterium]|nr:helicase-associated domain-containing protein [Thermoflexales bacterium]
MSVTPEVQLWPRRCTLPRHASINAETAIELTYSQSQIRRLLRSLKGLSRSAALPQDPNQLIEQTVETVQAFAAKASAQPEHLLAQLTHEEADLMRDLLTAREHILPFDEALIRQINLHPAEDLPSVFDRFVDRGLLFRVSLLEGEFLCWPPYTKAPIVRTWAVQSREPPLVSMQAAPFPEVMARVLDAISREAVFFRALMLPSANEHAKPRAAFGGWECDAQEAAQLRSSKGVRIPLLAMLTPESLRLLKQRTSYAEALCEFVTSLAYTIGLVEARRDDHVAPQRVVVDPIEAERWFSLTPEQQLLSAWHHWVTYNADWFEARQAIAASPFNRSFSIVRSLDAKITPAELAYELHGLRAYLARVLRGLPKGAWVYWPELAEQLFNFYPQCAWSSLSPSEWWFASPDGQTPVNVTQREDWSRTIGQILAQMLRGPLFWLGMVELSASTNSSAFSFRVTPLGQALLERATPQAVAALLAPAAPVPHEQVSWVDAYTVRLTSSLAWSALTAQTRLWAEPVQAADTYVFTPASVAAALKANRSVEALRAAYSAAGSALSSEVEALLAQIAQRRGRIRIYETMAVVQLADEATAREVLAHSTTLQQAYPLSPTTFAMPPQAAEALLHELRQRGYTPLVES